MAKKNIMDVTKEIYNRLEPLESDERNRVIKATLALLGQEQITSQSGVEGTPTDLKDFFHQKDPKTKAETLAVAARFREQQQNQNKHKKADLESVVTNARRNFDSHNFSADIRNAKNKGLFIKRKDIQLSYYGQQYVDALPDRQAIKNLRKPATRKITSQSKKKKKKRSNKRRG